MSFLDGPSRPARPRPPIQVVAAVVLLSVTTLVVTLVESVDRFAAGEPEAVLEEVPRLALTMLYAYALWRGGRVVRWFLMVLVAISLSAMLPVVDAPAEVVLVLAILTVLVLLLVAPDTWRSGQPEDRSQR
ncbi:hypothetical protein ACI2K4_09160 [Micromonospora sp. NPDC050397]|uniref:hypothetical protein n=1 Tax=Micromonospora sp. NPDC050397 TaxID=3364279 RepID=UPI00384BC742